MIEQNKPIFIGDYAKNLTVATAQKSNQISKIKVDKGVEYLENTIIVIIAEALKLVPNEMKPDSIVYITRLFIQEYWQWKIDDLVLCMKNGVMGTYGIIYGQLTFSVLIKWFNEYQKEKDLYYDSKLMEDHYKFSGRNENATSLLKYYKKDK